jgi:hypothetical protein
VRPVCGIIRAMSDDSIYARTLRRAMEILGGEQQLADRLRVPASELREWLAGTERPPMAYLLVAVEVVEQDALPRK